MAKKRHSKNSNRSTWRNKVRPVKEIIDSFEARAHGTGGTPDLIHNGTVVSNVKTGEVGLVEDVTRLRSVLPYDDDDYAYRLRREDGSVILVAPRDAVVQPPADQRAFKHRYYVRSVGVEWIGSRPFRRRTDTRRTHCWRCKRDLSSSDNPICERCGWLICECGACACGTIWDRNR